LTKVWSPAAMFWTSRLGSEHAGGEDCVKTSHSQTVPSAFLKTTPFTNWGETVALAMAWRTLRPGPSALPKEPNVSVPLAVSTGVEAAGDGLDTALCTATGAALCTPTGVALGAATAQAAVAAAIQMMNTIRSCAAITRLGSDL
jgi:hypothetical protein